MDTETVLQLSKIYDHLIGIAGDLGAIRSQMLWMWTALTGVAIYAVAHNRWLRKRMAKLERAMEE